jgi:hypothetical protein
MVAIHQIRVEPSTEPPVKQEKAKKLNARPEQPSFFDEPNREV